MNNTYNDLETVTVTPQDIRKAIARARRLRSEETARLLRAAGSKLRRLADAALHVRVPAGSHTRPLAH